MRVVQCSEDTGAKASRVPGYERLIHPHPKGQGWICSAETFETLPDGIAPRRGFALVQSDIRLHRRDLDRGHRFIVTGSGPQHDGAGGVGGGDGPKGEQRAAPHAPHATPRQGCNGHVAQHDDPRDCRFTA